MVIHHITMVGARAGAGMAGEGMVHGASMEDGKCTSIKRNNVVMGR
jgi:hypothetical protein